MDSRSKSYGIITWLLLIITIVLAVWLFIEINDDEPVTVTDGQNTEVVEGTSDTDRLSRITQNPATFYGTRTIIEGEIQDVYSDRVFTISDQTAGDELLVILRGSLSNRQADEGEELFEDNADAQVIGTVRQLVIAEVETDYGIDLDEEIEAEFESQPVMIGELVQYSDQDALFDFNQGVEEDR